MTAHAECTEPRYAEPSVKGMGRDPLGRPPLLFDGGRNTTSPTGARIRRLDTRPPLTHLAVLSLLDDTEVEALIAAHSVTTLHGRSSIA